MTAPAGAAVRGLAPDPRGVGEAVREILERVRDEGDAAVLDYTARWDTQGAPPKPLRVAPEELRVALAGLDPAVRDGLEVARANVTAVAAAGRAGDCDVELPEGQRVRLREVPLARAGCYVPGGRAPYPSTVVMTVATARAAGVEDVAV